MDQGPIGIILCGHDGRVRTASSGARTLFGSLSPGDLLDDVPALATWSEGAFGRLAAGESATLSSNGARVRMTAAALSEPDSGFALVVTRAPTAVTLPQDVARKTWHDIQNQLGGLKLYATFLKKKLGTADDQIRETADKIILGIDAVAQSISEARRGEEGRQNEKGQSYSGN